MRMVLIAVGVVAMCLFLCFSCGQTRKEMTRERAERLAEIQATIAKRIDEAMAAMPRGFVFKVTLQPSATIVPEQDATCAM